VLKNSFVILFGSDPQVQQITLSNVLLSSNPKSRAFFNTLLAWPHEEKRTQGHNERRDKQRTDR
jgi:hypothetical protein